MFLFETIALIVCVAAVAFAHLGRHLAEHRCPRCRLPAEAPTARAVVHVDALEAFETFEPGSPELALVEAGGRVIVRAAASRPVRRLLQRRETLVSHRCRLCRHTWQTGEVELVRGLDSVPGPGVATLANVRVFPRRPG